MAKLIINGGVRLKGSIYLRGAKNASFKLMIASLLYPGTVNLSNLCHIADVELVKKVIQQLGGIVELTDHKMTINSLNLNQFIVPAGSGFNSRASSLFLAPLLVRQKKAVVPLPGGDQIGNRPLDRHLQGLAALGVNWQIKSNFIHASCKQLIGNRYCFPKITHTGTETLIMAAVLAKGRTRLENCALEPEVDDLINFLNLMGAKIKRLNGRVIIIDGVEQLKGVNYSIIPDRNEAVSYAIAALVTKGEVVVKNLRPGDLTSFFTYLEKIKAGYEISGQNARFYYSQPLLATKIITSPHPGFMTDWQPLWSVLATQCQGRSEIIESVFSSRFQFVPALIKMGAKIRFFNPKPSKPDQFYHFNLDFEANKFHGIKIFGPTQLRGRKLIITDIRAGATLALAGLAASGQTILFGLEHIDRGYENFAGRLLNLGAKIKRIN